MNMDQYFDNIEGVRPKDFPEVDLNEFRNWGDEDNLFIMGDLSESMETVERENLQVRNGNVVSVEGLFGTFGVIENYPDEERFVVSEDGCNITISYDDITIIENKTVI